MWLTCMSLLFDRYLYRKRFRSTPADLEDNKLVCFCDGLEGVVALIINHVVYAEAHGVACPDQPDPGGLVVACRHREARERLFASRHAVYGC